MDLLDALSASLKTDDERDGRVYGFVVGRITNVSDPKNLGHVRARYMAQDAKEDSDWLSPIWPGAIEALPEVGQPVMIGFTDGDVHRGFYAWYPISTTQRRATEHMVLGESFAGLFNYLVTQFNQLRADAFAAHGTTAKAAKLALDSNGAAVGNIDSNRIVLSRFVKVK